MEARATLAQYVYLRNKEMEMKKAATSDRPGCSKDPFAPKIPYLGLQDTCICRSRRGGKEAIQSPQSIHALE